MSENLLRYRFRHLQKRTTFTLSLLYEKHWFGTLNNSSQKLYDSCLTDHKHLSLPKILTNNYIHIKYI